MHELNPHSGMINRRGRRARWIVAALLLWVSAAGCSRVFWRKQADKDVHNATVERFTDDRWTVPRIDVQAHPDSRIALPFDIDHAPLPPDDPAAHKYMHVLDGMRGYKNWHKLGQSFSIENPHWTKTVGLTLKEVPCDCGEGEDKEGNDNGDKKCEIIVPGIEDLTIQQAVELAAIHSREYQFQIEDVYLAALALTFERFQFDVRYLGLGGMTPTLDGEFESVPDVRDQFTLNSRFGISQMLPTGGQWILEFMNNTIWIFTSEDEMRTTSIISYAITQPLARGAGRKVVLENLTQAERDTLYQVRTLARFRKTFFTDIISGGPSGGFLGLIQQKQNIDNRRDNIRRLVEQIERERETALPQPEVISESVVLPEGVEFPKNLGAGLRYDAQARRLYVTGRINNQQARTLLDLTDDVAFQASVIRLIERSRTQIEAGGLVLLQLESQLTTSRAMLRSAEQRYQDALDAYKIQLGLPTDLPVTISPELLKQFELISPEVADIETRLIDPDGVLKQLAAVDEEDPNANQLRDAAAELKLLADEIKEDVLDGIRGDFRRAKKELPTRLERLRRDEDRERVERDVERDREFFQTIVADFDEIVTEIKRIERLLSTEETTNTKKIEILRNLYEFREALLKIVQNAPVVQVGLRTELITVQPVPFELDEAVEIGLVNRLDLKNTRGMVMDARRLVEVRANDLEAVLNLRAEGDVRTRGASMGGGIRPLDFRGSESSFRAGFNLQTPIDQVSQRNEYRAQLINYQRARRAYIMQEDQVKSDVRTAWRALRTLEENFETARVAIRVSALQFDNIVESTTSPEPGARQSGLDILRALDSVLSAQTNLIDTWVNYETARLNFYRDMGIMEIDARGLWVDKMYNPSCFDDNGNGDAGGTRDAAEFETLESDTVEDDFLERDPDDSNPENDADLGRPEDAGPRLTPPGQRRNNPLNDVNSTRRSNQRRNGATHAFHRDDRRRSPIDRFDRNGFVDGSDFDDLDFDERSLFDDVTPDGRLAGDRVRLTSGRVEPRILAPGDGRHGPELPGSRPLPRDAQTEDDRRPSGDSRRGSRSGVRIQGRPRVR